MTSTSVGFAATEVNMNSIYDPQLCIGQHISEDYSTISDSVRVHSQISLEANRCKKKYAYSVPQ